MPGAIAMVVALLLLPVGFFLGGALVSGLYGWWLSKDAEDRHEGSELLNLQ